MKEKNKNEKTVAITLEDAAAEQFLKDVEVMKSKAGQVKNPNLAKAIQENIAAIEEATQTDGFWSQTKADLKAFWTRVKTGFAGLRDWVLNTIHFVVEGVIDTLQLVADLFARVINGIAGFIVGTLEVVFGYGKPDNTVAPAAMAA